MRPGVSVGVISRKSIGVVVYLLLSPSLSSSVLSDNVNLASFEADSEERESSGCEVQRKRLE